MLSAKVCIRDYDLAIEYCAFLQSKIYKWVKNVFHLYSCNIKILFNEWMDSFSFDTCIVYFALSKNLMQHFSRDIVFLKSVAWFYLNHGH